MRKRRLTHISWKWQLQSTPEQLWPLLTDTNRLFRDLNQPSIHETHFSQHAEPSCAQLAYDGINRYEMWEEEPYEWEFPYRFGVVRHYQAGPYKDVKMQMDLHPVQNGTVLEIDFWLQPRLGILATISTFKLKTIFKRKLKKTISQYDRQASTGGKTSIVKKEKQLTRGGEKRLQQIEEELYNKQVNASVISQLVHFIRFADDMELKSFQPLELAKHWDMSAHEVLKACMQSAKAGLLNLSWDLRCPSCRSVQESVASLNQVYEPIFCEHCEKEFSINFNKTIELSFSPHPLIRKIEPKTYCNRGPQSKPHIVVQQFLKPSEQYFVKTTLPEGTYLLRADQLEGTAIIHVDNNGTDTVNIALHSCGLNGEEITITSHPNLSIENISETKQLVSIEKKSWDPHRVSAAKATSSQLFRNLFSNEVLRKGEKISVDNLTLMFTDLFESTNIYNNEGDDKAVGQVIQHFEILERAIANEEGAIVKTIGDSVMAVFCEPEQAMRAYIKAQKMLSHLEGYKNNLYLKAGIHHGSCVAVNLNNRIDFFGSTVNIASRFADYASENEVILSQKIFEDGNIEELLEETQCNSSIKNIATALKGFNSEPFLIKSIKIDHSPLRLAI